MTSEHCTEAKLRKPESPRSSSCMMRPYAIGAHAGAAVAFERRAERAQRAELLRQLHRERAGAEVLADDGHDSSSTKRRKVSRTSRSSSLRSSSRPK